MDEITFEEKVQTFFDDDDYCAKIHRTELALKASIVFDHLNKYIRTKIFSQQSYEVPDVSPTTAELYRELRWLVRNYVPPGWGNPTMEDLKKQWKLNQKRWYEK